MFLTESDKRTKRNRKTIGSERQREREFEGKKCR
jgi:hypothetical protein